MHQDVIPWMNCGEWELAWVRICEHTDARKPIFLLLLLLFSFSSSDGLV